MAGPVEARRMVVAGTRYDLGFSVNAQGELVRGSHVDPRAQLHRCRVVPEYGKRASTQANEQALESVKPQREYVFLSAVLQLAQAAD